MTWHYIFAKLSHRLLKYQRLTTHTHPATVEDQSDELFPETRSQKQKQPATVSRGGLFQFDHRDEEYPSFAGLAATYSSKS
jgi:hypothetical protein